MAVAGSGSGGAPEAPRSKDPPAGRAARDPGSLGWPSTQGASCIGTATMLSSGGRRGRGVHLQPPAGLAWAPWSAVMAGQPSRERHWRCRPHHPATTARKVGGGRTQPEVEGKERRNGHWRQVGGRWCQLRDGGSPSVWFGFVAGNGGRGGASRGRGDREEGKGGGRRRLGGGRR